VKVQSPCRLRDRRLTFKPRIVRAQHHDGFWVERLVSSSHPSIRGWADCKLVDTFPQAIAKALEWAGPKEKK
jgi:hypothetical protein